MRQLSVSQIRMHCSALQTIRMHRGQEGRVVVVEVEEGLGAVAQVLARSQF